MRPMLFPLIGIHILIAALLGGCSSTRQLAPLFLEESEMTVDILICLVDKHPDCQILSTEMKMAASYYLNQLEHGIEDDPEDPELVFRLGFLYFRSGEMAKAEECAERIRNNNGDDHPLYHKLMGMIRLEQAAREYSSANNAQDYNEEALFHLAQSLEESRNDPQVYYCFASALLNAKQTSQAFAVINEAFAKYPYDAPINFLYGTVCKRMAQSSQDPEAMILRGNDLLQRAAFLSPYRYFKLVNLDPLETDSCSGVGNEDKQ